MFGKFSKKITSYMVSNDIIALTDEEIYSYGIQQGLIIVLNIISVLVIGLILEMLWECVILLLTYIPIRTYAGGYHSKSSIRCYFYSLIFIITELQYVKYVALSQNLIIVIAVLAGVIIFKLAPVEAINKPLDEKEKKIYANKARKIFIIEIIVIIFAMIYEVKVVQECIVTTFIAIALMLMIGKIKHEYNLRSV